MPPVYTEQSTAAVFKKLNTADQVPKFTNHALWASWAAVILVGVLLAGIGFVVIDADERVEEIRLKQSTDLVVQRIESRLLGTAELLQKTSMRLMSSSSPYPDAYPMATAELSASSLMSVRREVLEIAVADRNGVVLQSWTSPATPVQEHFLPGAPIADAGTRTAIGAVFEKDSSAVSALYSREDFSRVYVNVLSPMPTRRHVLIARIDITRILEDAALRSDSETLGYAFAFLSNGERLPKLAVERTATRSTPIVYTAPLNLLGFPPAEDIRVEGVSYAHALFAMNRLPVFALAGFGLMLFTAVCFLFYYQRKQHTAHRLLAAEYSLRRAISESAVVGLRVTTDDGRILYVNETFQKLVGTPAEDLIGQTPPYSYWSDASEIGSEEALRRFDQLGGPYQFEAKRPNGETFVAETRLSPLFDENNRQLGVIGALYDVSEAVVAKRALEAANTRFKLVMDSLNSAIAVLELPDCRRRLFTNRAFDRIFADCPEAAMRVFTEAIVNNERPGGEGIYDRDTGRWWDVRTQAIRWTDGQPAVLAIAADITTKRELELAREAQMRRAESTQRLVTMGEMASSLAHELNQPLAAIANYAGGSLSRLEDSRLTLDQSATAFKKIASLAERAGRIILRIRGFAKKTDPVLEPVSAATVIQETMELALIQARKTNAKIDVRIEEGIPLLLGDSVMLEQVLLNLIKNAVEATAQSENRTIEVHAERVSPEADTLDAEGRAHIEFRVVDHGPGIDEEQKAQLFDAFYSTKTEGMGMGLNICRTIAEVHGGRIRVEDTEGGGTTFAFRVPVALESDIAKKREREEKAAAERAAREAALGIGKSGG